MMMFGPSGSGFNPRPREGGDITETYTYETESVSIHAPARGATGKESLPRRHGEVSIHAPARGATRLQHALALQVVVSIHAPARGATKMQRLHEQLLWVSIHAPARGATFLPSLFQPGEQVSIHAPARGATRFRTEFLCPLFRFNPRPREGGDQLLFWQEKRGTRFQSTPPRGGRLRRRCILRGCHQFQSTPPRGGRRLPVHHELVDVHVSIHAPARGATDFDIGDVLPLEGFNPRPREGGDSPEAEARTCLRGFNPRPREGGDLRRRFPGYAGPVSIHAPARGATRCHGERVYLPGVSIHAPARGATALKTRVTCSSAVSIHAPARGATRSGQAFYSQDAVSIHAPARGATSVDK